MNNTDLINKNLLEDIKEFFKLNPELGDASEWTTRVLTESFMSLKYKNFIPGKGKVVKVEPEVIEQEEKVVKEPKTATPINYATPRKKDDLYNE
jgi:hypothetical protein